jgi:hypothetical protein
MVYIAAGIKAPSVLNPQRYFPGAPIEKNGQNQPFYHQLLKNLDCEEQNLTGNVPTSSRTL